MTDIPGVRAQTDTATDDSNPYAPPTEEPRRGPPAVMRGKPRPWKTVEVLELAWQRVRAQLWLHARAAFFLLGLPQLVAYAPRMLFDLDAHGIPRGSVPAYIASVVAAQIGSLLITGYLTAGATKIWLDAARGRDARFGDLFGGGARAPSFVGAVVLLALAMAVGFLCLVVPGLIAQAGLGLAPYFVVDAKMGPLRALSASWEVTKGHRLALVGLWTASMLLLAVGSVACGVGVLVAYPITGVATAIVYLRLSGRGRKKRKTSAN